MNPDKGLAGVGTPVAEQSILDVLGLERFAEERVGAKVDHAGGKVVTGAPVGVHFLQFVLREGAEDFGGGSHDDSPGAT